jgi:hypothetical protein
VTAQAGRFAAWPPQPSTLACSIWLTMKTPNLVDDEDADVRERKARALSLELGKLAAVHGESYSGAEEEVAGSNKTQAGGAEFNRIYWMTISTRRFCGSRTPSAVCTRG